MGCPSLHDLLHTIVFGILRRYILPSIVGCPSLHDLLHTIVFGILRRYIFCNEAEVAILQIFLLEKPHLIYLGGRGNIYKIDQD